MLITSAGQDMINNSTTKVGNISSSLQAQLTSQYDGTVLNGSQVIAAIKANYTTENLILRVKNANGYVRNYGKVCFNDLLDSEWKDKYTYFPINNTPKKTASITPVGKLSDKTSAETYVSPTDKYNAYLMKYVNSGEVVGITFEPKD